VTIAAAPLARFPLSDTLSDKDMRPRVVLDRVVTVATDEDTQVRSVADDGLVVGVLPRFPAHRPTPRSGRTRMTRWVLRV